MQQSDAPLISVVMPVYNGERYLREAIDSILAQSFTDFEFIIVNDGSTDSTEAIIRSYTDARIVYIKNERNLKLIKTLNRGIEHARGKYIARMDADDISFPYRFEKQLEVFIAYPGIDIVNIKAYTLTEDGTHFREQKATITPSFEAVKYLIPLQNFISHPGVMVKADLLRFYRYVDEVSSEHIEDFDLWNRMLKDGCICYTLDQFLLYYRNTSNSINHTQKNSQAERMIAMCNRLLAVRFNFQFSSDTLNLLMEKKMPVNYLLLKQAKAESASFLQHIRTNYPVSSSACMEMETWRRQRLLTLSLKSLSNSNLSKKIETFIFIIGCLPWIANRRMASVIGKNMAIRSRKRKSAPYAGIIEQHEKFSGINVVR